MFELGSEACSQDNGEQSGEHLGGVWSWLDQQRSNGGGQV